MKSLTSKEYWQDYYKSNLVDKASVINVVSIYNRFWDLLVSQNQNQPPNSILEIGGYPGRYLAYLAEKYKLIPTSIDYNSDREMIENSMNIFDVKEFNIIQADIFNLEVRDKYDIVISNGFVEHFDDFEKVLDTHVKFLKKGGTLFLLIPNMRGYSWFYKNLVDRENLKIHNLKCMDVRVFKDFAKRNNLKPITIQYFGGFSFSVHQKLNLFQSFVFQIHRQLFKRFFNGYIEKHPGKYFSSSLIGIYRLG